MITKASELRNVRAGGQRRLSFFRFDRLPGALARPTPRIQLPSDGTQTEERYCERLLI
jgi:hypothetical protein